jgi:beta-lactamase class C
VLAVVVSVGSTPPKPPPPAEFAVDLVPEPVEKISAKVDYQQLDARIQQLMQQPDMVGLAVGTIENGQPRFLRGYGETRAKSGDPVTSDTVFRWASLSKSVASALVVGLAEQRRLALDTPLYTLGTTLTLPGDSRRVTIADLLSHRLGLTRNAWDDRLEAGEDPKLLRASLGTLASSCPPATCYAYQNVAFDTAAEIVESTTGQDYAKAATTRLFAPLGMTSTSIGRENLQSASSWAEPHRWGKTPTAVNDSYYRVPAAGGVNSSIRDLMLWMRAQMGATPAALSPDALALMHSPRIATPPNGRRSPMDRALINAAYGLGWRTYDYAGHQLVGHRGAVDGYGALVLFDPAERSGIVMLWNSNTGKPARLQLEFFDQLYKLPPTNWLDLPEPAPPQ